LMAPSQAEEKRSARERMAVHWVAPETSGPPAVVASMWHAHFAVFGDSQVCAVTAARDWRESQEDVGADREAGTPGPPHVFLDWWGGEGGRRWHRREAVPLEDLSVITGIWDVAPGDPGEVLLLLSGLKRKDGEALRACYSVRKGQCRLVRDLDDLGEFDSLPRFFEWQGNVVIVVQSGEWGGVPIRGAEASRICSAIKALCPDFGFPCIRVRFLGGRLSVLGQRELDGRWQLVTSETILDAPSPVTTVLHDWKGNMLWEGEYDFLKDRDAVVAELDDEDRYVLFTRMGGKWEPKTIPSPPMVQAGTSLCASIVHGGRGGDILVARSLQCRNESFPGTRFFLEAFGYSDGRWGQIGSHVLSVPALDFIARIVMKEVAATDLFISWQEDGVAHR